MSEKKNCKVVYFGDSLAVTLPYRFVKANGIKRGDIVRRTIHGDVIILSVGEGK